MAQYRNGRRRVNAAMRRGFSLNSRLSIHVASDSNFYLRGCLTFAPAIRVAGPFVLIADRQKQVTRFLIISSTRGSSKSIELVRYNGC